MRNALPALALAALAGCGGTAETTPEPLRVAAASDLQGVMPALVEAFRAGGGVEVVATFGSSGQLAQQIKQSAPFDVFLAANRKFVADLAADGTIDPASVRDYAVGTLVVVVRDEVAGDVRGIADLAKPSVKKVAIANPETAPYGSAAKQALEHAHLWVALEPKRVQAESVLQALQFVRTGNAEAGLVGSAIADAPGLKVVPIEPASYKRMDQALGVVAASRREVDAERFADFLTKNAAASALFRKAGFRLPEPR